jgi:hypothetical protein
MINELIIHVIFQLILSTIVFWLFMSKELTINVNKSIKNLVDSQAASYKLEYIEGNDIPMLVDDVYNADENADENVDDVYNADENVDDVYNADENVDDGVNADDVFNAENAENAQNFASNMLKYIPKEDGEALKSNFNLMKYHIVIVLILLPLCFIILFHRNGQYMTESLILALVYIIVLPLNILFTMVVAPKTYFDSNNAIKNTIIDFSNKKCGQQ